MSVDTENLEELRQLEQDVYNRIIERNPDKAVKQKPIDPTVIQKYIGIEGLPILPGGFIKLFPHDFVVEEETLNDEICIIEPEENINNVCLPGTPTIYADLVKVGLGTLDAISHLASSLHISSKKIGYAGVKDGRAVTSQRVSIRGARIDSLRDLSIPQIFLKFKHSGKGAMTVGQLKGNRFTILIRTEETVYEQKIVKDLTVLEKEGFPNFYGVQRFGNRILNPLLGKLLCQGKTQEAIKVYLTKLGPYDIPIVEIVRQKAAEHYGDWVKMKKIFDILPYTFRFERKMLDVLEKDNSEHLALLAIQDQVRYWVYGYNSYLVNRLLSRAYSGEQSIPENLSLPFSDTFSDELYKEDLMIDGTYGYQQHLWKLPFLQQKHRVIPAWVTPKVHLYKVIPEGVIISFSLPKAVYATTFLSFLFQISEGTPIPSWVQDTEIDTKEVLNTGSVKKAVDKLGYVVKNTEEVSK